MPPRKRQEEERLVVEEKYVKYVGLSDVRIIRKADWARINIEHDDVEWSCRNNFAISTDKLSKEVLEYCQRDPELVIVSP